MDRTSLIDHRAYSLKCGSHIKMIDFWVISFNLSLSCITITSPIAARNSHWIPMTGDLPSCALWRIGLMSVIDCSPPALPKTSRLRFVD